MSSLHSNQKLSDSLGSELAVLSFAERHHCALHEKELLLEVVKANASIDFIPVGDFGFHRKFRIWLALDTFKAAVNSFIIKNVEKLLEKETITEVFT